jgi:hypothetical protein
MPKAPKEKFECKHDYGGTRGVCTQVFNYSSQLKWHSLMHSGEKPFVCDHIINKLTGEKCGKSFGKKCHRNRHVDDVHLKIRDHECDHIIDENTGEKCGLSFGEKSNLKKHIDVVHLGEKDCICDHIIDETTGEKCGESFGAKANLNEHIMSAHTDKTSQEYLAFREKINIRYRKRYAADVTFKASSRIRTSFAYFMKMEGGKGTKTLHTEVVVGCTWDELVVHLHDNPFGYTVDMDHIDIDHIRPVCSFTLVDDPVEQHRCMNFNNLQLLPSAENNAKGGFYDAVAYAQTEASKAIEKLVPGWVAKYRG